MAKSAISGQNLCIGTGTESGYRYLRIETKWYRYQKKVVPVPKDSGTGTHSQKGLVLVPMLPATLIFVPLHC